MPLQTKAVQKGTRMLQSICGEGKRGRVLPLAAKVPQVKRTLERLVFLVKAFVTQAGCLDAYQLANLKHKDVAGRVVSVGAWQHQGAGLCPLRSVERWPRAAGGFTGCDGDGALGMGRWSRALCGLQRQSC